MTNHNKIQVIVTDTPTILKAYFKGSRQVTASIDIGHMGKAFNAVMIGFDTMSSGEIRITYQTPNPELTTAFMSCIKTYSKVKKHD